MTAVEEVLKLTATLPPELQQEVVDFVRSLLEKRSRPKQSRLRMSWVGGLREFRDKYTSLELQKKALEWRGN